MISATFWLGASRRILRMAEDGEIILITSREILEEYAEAQQYPEIAEVNTKEPPVIDWWDLP